MKPVVNLYIDNKIFTGWKSVQIGRSIENLSCSFELEAVDNIDNNPLAFSAGQSCYLEINDKRVITGYIDEVMLDINADSQTITLAGRDKAADLIDCAAIYKAGNWRNATLEQIASNLCAPFNIDVKWQVNDTAASEPFITWTIEPSETVFENLARAARLRGVLLTSNAQGDAVFMAAGSENVATLTLGENILAINIAKQFQSRFSLYRIIGNTPNWGNDQTPEQATSVFAEVTDATVERYRPTIILSDDNMLIKTGKIRADWERRRSIAHSQSVTVTVKDWFYNDSELWEPNQLVTLNAKDFQNTELLIVDVNYDLSSEGGIVARLLLMPRDGFLAPKELDTLKYLWTENNGY